MTDAGLTRVPPDLPEDPRETFDPTRIGSAAPGASDDPETVVCRSDPDPSHEPLDDAEVAPKGSSTYRLHRVIGRGGFAEVWEATQTSLLRTVAVKRLRDEILQDAERSQGALEDFRREAFTAAALEHPNIVPAYDAHEDPDGRPQLALKLVRGTTWREMIMADAEMQVGELLERHLPILIDVAQAVAFAHSRGIMHRDIKPSQVMVGEFGEVLLFDWGLALRFDETAPTRDGGDGAGSRGDCDEHPASPARRLRLATCPAGTPAFMAPEQTESTPDRLGPWTDVYLLGGTLYFLLTGTAPRTGVSAQGAFVLASLGEIEPPRQRAPERAIPHDLEQLAMWALDAEPERRPTAVEFIAKLQDVLSGAGERRESAELSRSVAASLPSLGDGYGELSQCLWHLARAEGLWSANPDIVGPRERVLERYAVAAIDNGDLELARRQAAQLKTESTRLKLESTIARRAAALRRTAGQRRLFLRVSLLLAGSLLAFGVKYTVDQHRAQVRLQEQRNAAVAARVQAEELSSFMLEDLTPNLESLGRLDLLADLARSSLAYYESFPPDEDDAGSMTRRSLALRNAARVLRDQGHIEQARVAVSSSLAVARKLVERDPDDPGHRAHLADRLLELGALMQRTSDPEAAQQAFTEAVTTYQQLLEADPGNADLRRGLARGLHGVAYEHWGRADLEGALAALGRAAGILEELVLQRPDDLESTHLLLEVRAREGHVLRDAGRLDEAVAVNRQAIRVGEDLVAAQPANMMYLGGLAESALSLGFALWQTDDLPGALQAYQKALGINRELARRDPSNQDRQRRLADTQANVGEMQRELGDTRGALRSLLAAVATLEGLAADNAGHADWTYSLAAALLQLGQTHLALSDRGDAEAAWRRAAQAMEPIAMQRGDLYYLDTYAQALLLLGEVERARPVVDRLLAKGWNNPAFEALCKSAGLADR